MGHVDRPLTSPRDEDRNSERGSAFISNNDNRKKKRRKEEEEEEGKRTEAEAGARSGALSGRIIINVTDAYFMARHRELLHRGRNEWTHRRQ